MWRYVKCRHRSCNDMWCFASNGNKKIIFFQICTELHVSSQLGWWSLTYRHVGCCTRLSIDAHLVLGCLVALLVVGSEGHIKKESTFFGPKRWNQFFFNLKQKISPLSVPKKHRRLCRKSRQIEWFPSWPPSFLAGQYL